MALLDHPVAFLPDITGSIVIAAERGATERALDAFAGDLAFPAAITAEHF